MGAGESKPLYKRWWIQLLSGLFFTVLLPNWLSPYTKSPLNTVHSIGRLAHWPLDLLYGWTEPWINFLAAKGPFDSIDILLPLFVSGWLTVKLFKYKQLIAKEIERESLEVSKQISQEKASDPEQLALHSRKLTRMLNGILTVSMLVALAILNIGSTVVTAAVASRQVWDQRMMMLKPFITSHQYDVLNAAFAGVLSAQDAGQVRDSFNAVVERVKKSSDATTGSERTSTSNVIPSAVALPPEY